MRLYLDNSFLNRPFDDSSISRNHIEAAILTEILDMVGSGRASMINSAVIEYENFLNPYPERQTYIKDVLSLASEYKNYSRRIAKRAEQLQDIDALTPYDARHITSAEDAKADFFITFDLSLVKKYTGKLAVTDPLNFYNNYGNETKK